MHFEKVLIMKIVFKSIGTLALVCSLLSISTAFGMEENNEERALQAPGRQVGHPAGQQAALPLDAMFANNPRGVVGQIVGGDVRRIGDQLHINFRLMGAQHNIDVQMEVRPEHAQFENDTSRMVGQVAATATLLKQQPQIENTAEAASQKAQIATIAEIPQLTLEEPRKAAEFQAQMRRQVLALPGERKAYRDGIVINPSSDTNNRSFFGVSGEDMWNLITDRAHRLNKSEVSLTAVDCVARAIRFLKEDRLQKEDPQCKAAYIATLKGKDGHEDIFASELAKQVLNHACTYGEKIPEGITSLSITYEYGAKGRKKTEIITLGLEVIDQFRQAFIKIWDSKWRVREVQSLVEQYLDVKLIEVKKGVVPPKPWADNAIVFDFFSKERFFDVGAAQAK